MKTVSNMASAAARAVWGSPDPDASVQESDPMDSVVDHSTTSNQTRPSGAGIGDSHILTHQTNASVPSLADKREIASATDTASDSQPPFGGARAPLSAVADAGLARKPAPTTSSAASTQSATTKDLPLAHSGTGQAQSTVGDHSAVPPAGGENQGVLRQISGVRSATQSAAHSDSTRNQSATEPSVAHPGVSGGSANEPTTTDTFQSRNAAVDVSDSRPAVGQSAAATEVTTTSPAAKAASAVVTDYAAVKLAGVSSAPAPGDASASGAPNTAADTPSRRTAVGDQGEEPASNPEIPAPRPLIEVAREHGGDAGKVGKDGKDGSDGAGAKTEDHNTQSDKSAAKADDAPVEPVHATGLRADGGDFDAAKPGAAQEASRLMHEKGIHLEPKKDSKTNDSETGEDRAHEGDVAGSGKPSLGQRMKEKLHKY